MVAARVRGEFQNADVGCSRSARLSPRCFKRVRSVYHTADAESAVEDVVLSGRRALGAQAAEFAAMVQNRERLGGPVVWRDDLRVVQLILRSDGARPSKALVFLVRCLRTIPPLCGKPQAGLIMDALAGA